MNLNTVKIKPELLNIALLILRIVMGTMMIANHGWTKVVKYEVLKTEFFSFLGLGSQFSLILAILAEILCSILVIFGLFTRAALVPLIITMLRSEEHTSELQSRPHLVCRLLLEKKNYFDFERIEALKPAIEACGISTLSQSPMLGFHKQMDNRIKLLEEILSFRMQGVEFDNGDMYVDGHIFFSIVRHPPISTLFPYTTLFR